MNVVLGDVLLKCGQLPASILRGPFDKVLCLRTVVAKILEVQEHPDQLVGSRRRQQVAKDALRQLIVHDSLASGLADRLHDIFKRVETSCRRQDLALVLFGFSEDGTNVLARVGGGFNEWKLCLGRDDVGNGVGVVANGKEVPSCLQNSA